MRLFISIILFIFIFNISQAIQVSGDVFGTWSAEDNPYEVIGDLHVPQCSTLVIEPGCYIDFQGYYTFIVDTSAILQAIGNETDSIVFTASDTTEGWYGLRFFSAGNDCEITYSIIEYGKTFDEPYEDEYPFGGGLYIANSNLLLSHSNIRDNAAYIAGGGGIYAINSDVEISDCIFKRNRAGVHNGGAICCEFSIMVIISNVFNSCWVTYPLGGASGGAIAISQYSNALIENNVFTNNSCTEFGAAVYFELLYTNNAIISNNIITNNYAVGYGDLLGGGGIFLYFCQSVIVKGNLIAYNHSGWNGGGIGKVQSNIIAYDNTIYGNSAYYYGGGYFSLTYGNDTLYNNIIYNNSAGEYPQLLISDTCLVEYSCIQGGWPGEGNIDVDPMFVDPAGGDFHLSWDNYPLDDETKSPCIDAGAPWSPLDPDSTRADMGALSFDQHVGIDDDPDRLPRQVRLEQNYPNPFNAQTVIKYELPQQSRVTIEIYDILGRKVTTLIDKQQPAGYHQAIWRADDFSSGVYFAIFRQGYETDIIKMLLLK